MLVSFSVLIMEKNGERDSRNGPQIVGKKVEILTQAINAITRADFNVLVSWSVVEVI